MQLRDAMLQRRSIRAFLPDPVKREDVEVLLQYAMSGPSACNKRPWEFYVVTRADLLEQLRVVASGTRMVSPLNIIVAGNTKKAPAMQLNEFWIHDCAAATQNILLGAVELGLGACWCGLKPQKRVMKKVQDILGMEPWIEPLALVHIGYPNEEKEPRTQYDPKKVHFYAEEPPVCDAP